jgi:hypothetical protein
LGNAGPSVYYGATPGTIAGQGFGAGGAGSNASLTPGDGAPGILIITEY